EWCGPCKMIGPVVEDLAAEYEGKAIIAKLNVDENPNTTVKFGVRSIPTLLVFKGGKIVDKQVGAVPKSVLAQKLEAQLA
ncbi:MAG: thioredoxin, partial [Bacteroidota bacterium]